mgnify:CR=1 FL=1
MATETQTLGTNTRIAKLILEEDRLVAKAKEVAAAWREKIDGIRKDIRIEVVNAGQLESILLTGEGDQAE